MIGGATETVRELVAAWEQREVMAREVAVDVASHSPQVDPILDELTEVLADIDPLTPTVPYYSATSFDPREEPYCDADYWVDNLRHTVRFAAAVQAALEDGFRVFAELSPHPLLTHAVDQTARSLDISVAALAGMRREQPLPHGLRELLGDLHTAGAAVDFSVLYPAGRLVDAPLPAWTHRRLMLEATQRSAPRRQHRLGSSAAGRACAVAGGAGAPRVAGRGRHRRRCPGWPITKSTVWLPFPAPPTARWRLARPAPFSARHPRSATSVSSRTLLLDEETTVGAIATVEASRRRAFSVETTEEGTTRGGRPLSCTPPTRTMTEPPAHDMSALQRRIRPGRRGARCANRSTARHPIRSGVHRSGRSAHR